MRLALALVCTLAAGACGGDDAATDDADGSTDHSGDSDSPDDGVLPDGGHDDAPVDASRCTAPTIDATELRQYIVTTLAQIASEPRYFDTERARARTKIANAFTAGGLTPELVTFGKGQNVYARLPATAGDESDDPIIIGAHFDTVQGSPGADDNGSGTVIVLALARIAAQLPCRRSAIEFIAFDIEEEGLFGSRAAAQMRDPAVYRAVYTFDQVGFNSDGDATFELELPTPALEAEWQAAASVVGATLRVTASENTDHQSFREEGFAAVGLSEEYVGGDTTPHYHMPSDTPDTIDPDALVLATRLAAQVMTTAVAADP